jgi:phenylacetate-CoA ligase
MKQQREFVVSDEKRLATVLGVHAKVKLVEPSRITRHEGKANRVIDKRKV